MRLCRNGLHKVAPGTPCRECYLARQQRYNRSDKGRARWLRYYDSRMDDPDPVRRAIFRGSEGLRKWRYHARKARERRDERFGASPPIDIQAIVTEALEAPAR